LLAEVKKEKEEAQVDYDKKQIAKQNADVLNKLFYLYCKIVKSTHLSKFFTSALDGILK
jgi:nucleolar complex protein 3